MAAFRRCWICQPQAMLLTVPCTPSIIAHGLCTILLGFSSHLSLLKCHLLWEAFLDYPSSVLHLCLPLLMCSLNVLLVCGALPHYEPVSTFHGLRVPVQRRLWRHAYLRMTLLSQLVCCVIFHAFLTSLVLSKSICNMG